VTSAALLRRPGIAPTAIEHAAAIVERQASSLARLLDDLLDVSRITRDRIELRWTVLSVGDAVERALEATRPLLDERRHALSVSLPHRPVHVEADPARLEQIIVNLVNNAAKYTPPGGRISVVVAEEGESATLRVSDTGIGIPEDMLSRIFELFVQGDQSLANTSGGLGIGLTLVHRLVKLHRGRVEARSDGAGRGSEFVVTLPLSRQPVSPGGPASAPARWPPASVLLIEDNDDARQSLRALLEHDGHRVEEASDGASGLDRDEALRPDVVLIDIGLPGLDG